MRMLQAAAGEILELAFSPEADGLAVAVEYHGVFLWNLALGGSLPVRPHTDTNRCKNLQFTSDSRSLVWLGSRGLRVFNRDSKSNSETHFDVPGRLFGLTQTPDGGRLITLHGIPEPTLVGWRATEEGREQDWSISTEDLSVTNMTICPLGRRLALLSRPTDVKRWWEQPIQLKVRSAVSGVVEAVGDYPYKYSSRLVFSPDGSQLIAIHDMTLLVWPVPELGEPRMVRNDSRQHFTSVAFHPSGRYLFATSNDTTVHVFDTVTWDRVRRFTWNIGRLRAAAVSADGTLAAAGGDKGEIVIWDVDA